MDMSKQNIDPRIINLCYNDPVVANAVYCAIQNNMSEKEFLIILVEALVDIKNKLNNEIIDTKLNGSTPICIINTDEVELIK